MGHHRILGRVPFEPPTDPRQARRTAIWRLVSFVMAISLVGLVAYLAYVGYDGSQVFGAHSRSGDCRTPASAFGWPYEAINYDLASDSELDALPDRTACPAPGEAAGGDLTTADGVRIAGWYIPAASQDASAPTVVLAHGNGKTKSDMLTWAEPLHAVYNLVLFDFRNHGQSSGDVTTLGVREARDLKAVVDWLERAKALPSIAVLGVSMGGAAAIDEATTDDRVAAVILDSTHATLASHAGVAREPGLAAGNARLVVDPAGRPATDGRRPEPGRSGAGDRAHRRPAGADRGCRAGQRGTRW